VKPEGFKQVVKIVCRCFFKSFIQVCVCVCVGLASGFSRTCFESTYRIDSLGLSLFVLLFLRRQSPCCHVKVTSPPLGRGFSSGELVFLWGEGSPLGSGFSSGEWVLLWGVGSPLGRGFSSRARVLL
jgi:hypothetical protein